MDKTLTKSQMGYMIRKRKSKHLLNTVNFILGELELRAKSKN